MKPNIYKPLFDKKIANNKKAYYSFLEDKIGKADEGFVGEAPVDTINRLTNSGSYIFNRKVDIITNDKTYHTKIAGKVGDRIVTIDGDNIFLDDIKQIIEKQ